MTQSPNRLIPKSRGVTLVELLITVLIISIIVSISFLGHRELNERLTLQRAVYQIVADIERTREMAMSAQEFEGTGGIPEGGYGIYFDISTPNEFILFADLDLGVGPDRVYSGVVEQVEKIYLDGAVEVSALSPSSPINIVFLPPAPNVFLVGGSSIDEVEITIILKSDFSKTRKIYINSAGLVSIGD
jgi:prepilin-type N-terminal cleavage/methylation domain-containing protein